jgi:hypothetical protein
MNLDAFSKGFSERYAQLEKKAEETLEDHFGMIGPFALLGGITGGSTGKYFADTGSRLGDVGISAASGLGGAVLGTGLDYLLGLGPHGFLKHLPERNRLRRQELLGKEYPTKSELQELIDISDMGY